LERVTDEKLTHMLSIQKSPTDKTQLWYVASSFDMSTTTTRKASMGQKGLSHLSLEGEWTHIDGEGTHA